MMWLKRLRPSRYTALLIVLLLTFLLMLRPMDLGISPRIAVVGLFKPVFFSLNSLSEVLSDFARTVLHWRRLVEENRRLRQRITMLESKLARTQDRLAVTREQFESLKTFLLAHENLKIQGVIARVIGLEASNWRMSVLVDKGAEDGVEKMQPVVWFDAAVGIVAEVSGGPFGGVSRVRLLSDPQCKVWVRSLRSRGEGILVGIGNGLCAIEKVAPRAEIKKGDIIVTTGKAGIFPESMLVGAVTDYSVKGNTIRYIVKPRIAAEELHNVMILQRVSARVR